MGIYSASRGALTFMSVLPRRPAQYFTAGALSLFRFTLVLKIICRLLATGSADATIKIWSLTDHSCVKQLEGHDCSVLRLLWISESQVASSASDGLVKVLFTLQTFGIWDVWSRCSCVFFSLGELALQWFYLYLFYFYLISWQEHILSRQPRGPVLSKRGDGHAAQG